MYLRYFTVKRLTKYKTNEFNSNTPYQQSINIKTGLASSLQESYNEIYQNVVYKPHFDRFHVQTIIVIGLIALLSTFSPVAAKGINRNVSYNTYLHQNSTPPLKSYLLILSKGSESVLVLDYNTLDSITSIPVGIDPHEIISSPDGHKAYISRPEMNNNGHHITIVNLEKLEKEQTIDTRPFFIPHGLAYHNNELWFTAQGSKAVAVYDLQTNKVAQVFGTGQDFTHLIQLRPDAKAFYTTNVESGTVSIYQLEDLPPYMPPTGVLPTGAKPRKEWRQTLVQVEKGCEGFDVSKDGKELWTASPAGNIFVIDLEKKRLKARINTGIQGLHRLKITQDGKTVCIVSVKTGDLLYYNRETMQLEQTVKTGQGAGIYMDAKENRMFISCTPNNYVSVVDLSTRKEIRRIKVGRPDGITSVTVK